MARRLLILTALVLSGCHLGAEFVEAPQEAIADLPGEVRFPARTVQANLQDIAKAATVSLINADTNRTETTTLTNASGSFRLTFPTAFRPSATSSYYLEAIKGLDSNRAGSFVARIRTLARYDKGWTTLTNALPGGSVQLNTATTALCLGAAIRSGTASPVDLSALIGKYDGVTQTYIPVANLSSEDFSTLRTFTEQILALDQDPMAGVVLTDQSQWLKKSLTWLTLAQLDPPTGGAGTAVTISGAGFALQPADNIVRFNGVLADVLSASPTALTVAVPMGATPGPVTVQVGAIKATGPTFDVTNLVFGDVLTQN